MLKGVARQLRQPDGEAGRDLGHKMNVGNQYVNQQTLASLQVQPQDRILEIGMGNGFFVPQLLAVDSSVRYVGCDFSPTMVEEAFRLNQAWVTTGQARFLLASADELPFEPNTFNKCFTVNTVYFWTHPARTLAELRRVLTPGGQLLVAARPRRVMERLPFVQYGFTLYSAPELVNLLEANGFSVAEVIEQAEPEQTIASVSVPMETLIVKAEASG